MPKGDIYATESVVCFFPYSERCHSFELDI